jgi:hypothetical protein
MRSCFPEEAGRFKDATNSKLSDVFGNDDFRGKVDINYEYDHGDSRDHQIVVMGAEMEGFRTAITGTVEREFRTLLRGEVSDLLRPCNVNILLTVG